MKEEDKDGKTRTTALTTVVTKHTFADGESGESFSVNPIGIEILNLIREEKNPEQIRKVILEKYSTDEITFEKDYHDFIGILEHNNLLERHEETKA